MRRHSSLACRAALVVALLLGSSNGLAASGKHKKPKHPTPAAADAPAPDNDASAKTAAKPSADAPALPSADARALPSADARAKSDDKPAPDADAASPAKAAAVPELRPKPDDQVPIGSEDEALGRREVARIAAGRVEVAVLLGVDVGNRRFKYSDPIGRLLAPYTLPVAPMASFGLEAYPLASSNVPGLRDLGLRGRFSRAFALDSNTPDGSKIATSWTRFGGELRERLLFPGAHPFELGIDVGADASYFVLSTASKVAALLPTARTISVSLGFDARLLLAGRVSFLLGGAYLAVTSPGEIYDRFREPRVAGVDGDFGLAIALTPGLEGRLTGRYTRYFASFKPKVGDPAVAGGALDEQLQFGLGVRYAH